MKLRRFWPILFLLVSGPVTADEPWTLRVDGIGPARIGMNLAQLNVALGESFSLPEDKDEQACFYVEPSNNSRIELMILDAHFARVDVREPGIATKSGIQVGDTEDKVLKAYGRNMEIGPQKYTDGHFLTLHSSDKKLGIRFETDDGKVSAFYAGTAEAIQLVEGCQ